MNTINWNEVRIRASAFSKLMTEPKDAAAKKAGDLSATAKTYLKELYIDELWGLSRDLQNKYCDKGKKVEPDMINMLSILDGELYSKNEERIENPWFTGIPDIYLGDDIRNAKYVVDGKSSWSPWTFIAKMGEKLDKEWWTQMQIYLELCNCPSGEISVCLLSTPMEIVLDEQRRAMYAMGALTQESPEYLKVAEEIERNNNFEHIPMKQRRIKFPVQRDDEFIEQAKLKVVKAREYLSELHKSHITN